MVIIFYLHKTKITKRADTSHEVSALILIRHNSLPDSNKRKYVYGILGIAKLFGCSLPTANRIKKSGKIDKAITQIGRKIIVDVELALELAGKKTGGRK